MADQAAQKDPFGWFSPRPPQQRVNQNQVIGGSFGGFEEYESFDIQETVKTFDTQGSISFKETIIKQAVVVPEVGEKLIKATELTGKATEEVAAAGWDLLKMVLGVEKKPKKSEKPEDRAKIAETAAKQQIMDETARAVAAEAKARQTKNSLEEYRKQVNKVLGITDSFEGTMDDNGQLRADIKISYEKTQAEQQEAAEKAKKEKEMAALKPKSKPGQGVDLRQSAMTEKTAGGSALTTVG